VAHRGDTAQPLYARRAHSLDQQRTLQEKLPQARRPEPVASLNNQGS